MHEFSATINQLCFLSLVAQSSPEINKPSQEKEHYLDTRERQIQELHQQLAASKQVTGLLQQNLHRAKTDPKATGKEQALMTGNKRSFVTTITERKTSIELEDK